jgi:hypothetical protein
MIAHGILLLPVVLGQFSTQPTTARPRVAQTQPAPATTTPQRTTPSKAHDLVRGLMRLPPGSHLTGQPLTLAQALGQITDRQQQTRIVHAYWDLAIAMADYNLASSEFEFVAALLPTPAGANRNNPAAGAEPELRQAYQAAEQAALKSEGQFRQQQQTFAQLIRHDTRAGLPIPSDLPHVGVYHTRFEEVYSNRQIPPRAWLIHHILPIELQAIDARASAVRAAEDLLAHYQDAYVNGQVGVATLLSAHQAITRDGSDFVRVLREANDQIASYALPLADPNLPPAEIAKMLARKGDDTGGSSDSVRPAAYLDSSPASGDLRDEVPGYLPGTSAAPLDEVPAERQPFSYPVDPNTVPDQASHSTYRVMRVAGDGMGGLIATRYSDLADIGPARRSQRLAGHLHQPWALPQDPGQPLQLTDCLARAPQPQRPQLIEAYWLASQHVAAYQVRSEQLGWVETLRDHLLESRHGDSGAGSMLAWRHAQLRAQSALLEQEAGLRQAQFRLAELTGWRLQSAQDTLGRLPLPATIPHGGRYETKWNTQSARTRSNAQAQELVNKIDELQRALQTQATTVAEVDWARTSAVQTYTQGRTTLEQLLAAMDNQTYETLVFLDSLERYNEAIGQYALVVLGGEVANDRFVRALVVTPTVRR